LVRERAKNLMAKFCPDPDDPFTHVNLTGQQLAEDTARLCDEANGVNIFGGVRVVSVSGSGSEMTEAVKLAFANPNPDSRIIIRANDVNTRHALVKLCESSKFCAAIGCYSDDQRSLQQIARDLFASHNITLSAEVMSTIISRLGGDRQMSVSELEKLALLCGPNNRLSLEDVHLALGDSGAVAIDEVVLALLTGNTKQFEQEYSRLRREGVQPIAVIRQLLGIFKGMFAAKLAQKEGQAITQALSQFRPPLHFKMKPVVSQQLTRWSVNHLSDAIERLMQAERQTKSSATADPTTLTGQILLGICLRARSLNRR